jgi:hypothetical protein
MSEEGESTRFVVKGTTPSRAVVWLSPPDSNGFRNFGPRRTAEVFQDKSAARLAIAEISRPIRDAGCFFWVEVAHTNADKRHLIEITMKTLREAGASEARQIAIRQMIESSLSD